MNALRKVIAGGQTGVDQAALRAARDCRLEIGGWCPPGRESEAGVIPAEFPLQETEQERSNHAPDVPRSQRTEWNVRDADGVLVLGAEPLCEAVPNDAGTKWAMECAQRYEKPLLICEVEDGDAVQTIQEWLAANDINVLSVDGPSEGTCPGIGDKTYALVSRVFEDRS